MCWASQKFLDILYCRGQEHREERIGRKRTVELTLGAAAMILVAGTGLGRRQQAAIDPNSAQRAG